MTNLSDFFPAVPAYTPAMMEFDGTASNYKDSAVTYSGNLVTGVARFRTSGVAGTGSRGIADFGGKYGVSYPRLQIFIREDSATSPETVYATSYNSAGTQIMQLVSNVTITDNVPHTLFVAFDADNGTALFILDGVSAIDSGSSLHIAPTTGTMATGSLESAIGAVPGSGGPSLFFPGDIGFIGYRDAYLTNWIDFMDRQGNPRQLDETTWTEWGAQPLFWNEHAEMTNNLGSAGNMTENGTIIVGKGGN